MQPQTLVLTTYNFPRSFSYVNGWLLLDPTYWIKTQKDARVHYCKKYSKSTSSQEDKIVTDISRKESSGQLYVRFNMSQIQQKLFSLEGRKCQFGIVQHHLFAGSLRRYKESNNRYQIIQQDNASSHISCTRQKHGINGLPAVQF